MVEDEEKSSQDNNDAKSNSESDQPDHKDIENGNVNGAFKEDLTDETDSKEPKNPSPSFGSSGPRSLTGGTRV